MEGGRGPHLSEDTFRRVEDDGESWQGETNTASRASKTYQSQRCFFIFMIVADQFKIECQYCHVSITASNLTTHEVIFPHNAIIMSYIIFCQLV